MSAAPNPGTHQPDSSGSERRCSQPPSRLAWSPHHCPNWSVSLSRSTRWSSPEDPHPGLRNHRADRSGPAHRDSPLPSHPASNLHPNPRWWGLFRGQTRSMRRVSHRRYHHPDQPHWGPTAESSSTPSHPTSNRRPNPHWSVTSWTCISQRSLSGRRRLYPPWGRPVSY